MVSSEKLEGGLLISLQKCHQKIGFFEGNFNAGHASRIMKLRIGENLTPFI